MPIVSRTSLQYLIPWECLFVIFLLLFSGRPFSVILPKTNRTCCFQNYKLYLLFMFLISIWISWTSFGGPCIRSWNLFLFFISYASKVEPFRIKIHLHINLWYACIFLFFFLWVLEILTYQPHLMMYKHLSLFLFNWDASFWILNLNWVMITSVGWSLGKHFFLVWPFYTSLFLCCPVSVFCINNFISVFVFFISTILSLFLMPDYVVDYSISLCSLTSCML